MRGFEGGTIFAFNKISAKQEVAETNEFRHTRSLGLLTGDFLASLGAFERNRLKSLEDKININGGVTDSFLVERGVVTIDGFQNFIRSRDTNLSISLFGRLLAPSKEFKKTINFLVEKSILRSDTLWSQFLVIDIIKDGSYYGSNFFYSALNSNDFDWQHILDYGIFDPKKFTANSDGFDATGHGGEGMTDTPRACPPTPHQH